ncbi:T9SS sorting signal type C domain-containing protein [Flavobacterium sp. PL002]|uniref:DUF7507 domain-containing protein n=1 Tax=Flavobacterium sp. PL002 TaxID=1897058 RepID=UPI0019FC9B75|nr:T9SS sorting signal type C domain-containing protein [Flavobacterium sp. PL002]MBE0390361.1 hypothetical protein [Flavobacterium sp. PL002]
MTLNYFKLTYNSCPSLFRIIFFHSVFSYRKLLFFIFFLVGSSVYSQTAVNQIYTDWNGYWSSSTATATGNQPNTENNLLAFKWNSIVYSTGVNDAILTTKGVSFNTQAFRALKIQSLGYTSSTYFLQGAMMDGSLTARTLIPAISGSITTAAELAYRLTDGLNGLSLGTGIANIASSTSEFKIGTDNISLTGIGDGVPDIVVSQVAQPSSATDTFKFIDATGATVGTAINVAFNGIQVVGTYRLDLFNANNGLAASSFSANDTRDIRLLAMDLSTFGITSANAASVDRFVVNFSGSSDCAFIAVNKASLKTAELSLVKKASMSGCGVLGDKINYSFEVTNTGETAITDIVLSDPLPGLVLTTNVIPSLAAGETKILTAVYTITATDVTAGKVVNSASVSGIDPSLNTVSDVSGQTTADDISTVVYLSTVPSVPTIGTITQPNCITTTGSVALSSLPSSGSWTVTASPTTAGLTGLTGTGVTTTVSGLTAGTTYTFIVSNGSCSSGSSSSAAVNTLQTVSYNGSSWSGTPDLNKVGVITGTGTISSDVDLCSCTVNAGVTATVASGKTVQLRNQLTVNGTMIFEDQSSLVQINDAAINSGNITYKRETTAIDKFDYTYWSTPVKNQRLIDVSPTTSGDKFLSFDSSVNNWKYETNTNIMTPGKGYIIRGPEAYSAPNPPSTYEASFIGEPNNGVVSVTIAGTRVSNLMGNPYPSAVSADAFLTANNSVLSGTLYFWTHNTDIGTGVSNPGTGAYAYSSDDYASYNLTGGTGTSAVSGGSTPLANTSIPTGEIAAGQSFFGTSIVPGTAIFNNSMRLDSGVVIDNAQFFKQVSSSKETSVVEKNRLWLDLMNDQGAFKQTLIGYITGATNDYESAYDGSSFNANAYVNFYSLQGTSAMAIQGRALPFDQSDIVPLGYKSTIAGDFKIAIDQVDGFFTSQVVYLEDKLLSVIHNLNDSPYTFTTEIGVFDDRFVISYANKTLATDDFVTISNTVFIASKDKAITITASVDLIDKVYVYDFSGRQLYSKAAIDSNILVMNNLTNANVALIIKVVLNNGELITRKIAY